MIDKTEIEMKEESKNSEFSTKDREMSVILETDKLRRMGFKYPWDTLQVIKAVERGEDPKSIKSALLNSRLMTKNSGHLIFFFSLSDPSWILNDIGEAIPIQSKDVDRLLFVDRKWVPVNNGKVLHKAFDAICDGKSVEEALECLKKEETEAPTKPEEGTPAPANPDPTMEEVDLQNALSFCKDIFEEKFGLYGASFCDMHPETVTDQLFMKATILKRRLTDRNKSMRLGFAFFEGIRDEFAAVVNYGVIALRQAGFGVKNGVSPESPVRYHTCKMQEALSLICEKGADYGELWRELRIGTFSDMIYTKVRRLKSIENQYRVGGMTEEKYRKVVGDQYKDLINYGLFGVVRMTEIIDYLQLEMEDYESDEEEDDDE